MKANEVPQDDANLFEGKLRDVAYALDENGKYTTVKSVGWDPKNTVMLHAWDHENAKIAKAKELVMKGAKSPVYFYMIKCLMNVKLLASYTGFSGFRVRKHFKPKVFNKLGEQEISRYIYAFGLKQKEDLFKID